mmetsp:Transcript_9423/g.15684  ORF Transcript_9423/g.15684 Transcript_9423/m.15684 type:complete len:526 (+) Transcript_9423:1723-3300(+)
MREQGIERSRVGMGQAAVWSGCEWGNRTSSDDGMRARFDPPLRLKRATTGTASSTANEALPRRARDSRHRLAALGPHRLVRQQRAVPLLAVGGLGPSRQQGAALLPAQGLVGGGRRQLLRIVRRADHDQEQHQRRADVHEQQEHVQRLPGAGAVLRAEDLVHQEDDGPGVGSPVAEVDQERAGAVEPRGRDQPVVHGPGHHAVRGVDAQPRQHAPGPPGDGPGLEQRVRGAQRRDAAQARGEHPEQRRPVVPDCLEREDGRAGHGGPGHVHQEEEGGGRRRLQRQRGGEDVLAEEVAQAPQPRHQRQREDQAREPEPVLPHEPALPRGGDGLAVGAQPHVLRRRRGGGGAVHQRQEQHGRGAADEADGERHGVGGHAQLQHVPRGRAREGPRDGVAGGGDGHEHLRDPPPLEVCEHAAPDPRLEEAPHEHAGDLGQGYVREHVDADVGDEHADRHEGGEGGQPPGVEVLAGHHEDGRELGQAEAEGEDHGEGGLQVEVVAKDGPHGLSQHLGREDEDRVPPKVHQ